LDSLGRAIEISEPRGYTRFFDDGPDLDTLLRLAVERKIHAKYAKQLLAAFQGLRANHTTVHDRSGEGHADLLSERELEVLRMLAGGLTPAEVAKRLFLSPFTLKAHTQNIYTKLGVHSRIEAINKARELQMI
jgi:LuxR family maltose regulon positive regulatory protein